MADDLLMTRGLTGDSIVWLRNHAWRPEVRKPMEFALTALPAPTPENRLHRAEAEATLTYRTGLQIEQRRPAA